MTDLSRRTIPLALPALALARNARAAPPDAPTRAFADLERRAGGRLDWMLANTTGKERIEAGVPAGRRVADKTGAGGYGTTNDVGIVFPPRGAPVVVAIDYTGATPDAHGDSRVVADAAAIVARTLAGA
jgi:beta-lactamase class A